MNQDEVAGNSNLKQLAYDVNGLMLYFQSLQTKLSSLLDSQIKAQTTFFAIHSTTQNILLGTNEP